MSEKSDSSVKLFSYHEDQPVDGKGRLIPRRGDWKPKRSLFSFIDINALSGSVVRVGSSVFGVLALVVLGTSGYGFLSEANMSASPIVTIIDPETRVSTNLEYGEQKAFLGASFFAETRDAFINENLTFIEIDLDTNQLRFFREGVLLQGAEILNPDEVGTWSDVPPGLYKVEKMEKNPFNTSSQTYLPWLITFQGNYLIHGWPAYPNKTSVKEDFNGGGIRLTDQSAELLYQEAEVGIPILVHSTTKPSSDNFVYEPQVFDLTTGHYYAIDLTNGTTLASNEADKPVPIASLVKLMTAIVATEKINLDDRIQVTSPTFVTSLIPRLAERSSVSMYSLLQLLLVESSNEAAETIAGEVGREEFLKAMNDKARQLGLLQTNFADPSGLSSENVSSASDLYLLTKYIYENKRFIFDITANKALDGVYVGGEFEELMNFNEVKEGGSFIGGKVGETEAAGQTSISIHEIELQGEKRVVVLIILGSEDRTKDILTLISDIQNRFNH